jgi:hypothetical protein
MSLKKKMESLEECFNMDVFEHGSCTGFKEFRAYVDSFSNTDLIQLLLDAEVESDIYAAEDKLVGLDVTGWFCANCQTSGPSTKPHADCVKANPKEVLQK